jgi:adenosylcobinamide amidohydrolase
MRARLQTHTTTDRVRPVLVWRSPRPVLTISSAGFGGGMGLRSWVVNAEVPSDYDRIDLAEHAGELKSELQLAGDGVMLLTSASVEKHAVASDGDLVATATVGLTVPTWAASDDEPLAPAPGTVNVVAWVPVRLALSALVGAVGTVTEAKVQALLEAGVPGSGTPSDAVCVACPATGPVETFAGVRSEWGARLARVVHAAVGAGTAAEGTAR